MDLAKISYDQSTKTYNDTKLLFESGAVSSDQLDQAALGYKNAQASYQSASLNYTATVSGLNDQSDFYAVKSPVDGLITSKNIEKGMFSSSQNGFTIIVDDSLKIDATVASKYISQVAVGQPVDIYVNTLNKHFKGELTSISYAAKKGSYPVEIMFTETDGTIYSGMYAELIIEIAHEEDVLLLPIEALMREGNTSYVFKAVDGIAVKTPVSTGIRSNKMIEVEGDLLVGDTIIVEGKEFIRDGIKVMVK
jgi:RND family efflux transporter MFP subunit